MNKQKIIKGIVGAVLAAVVTLGSNSLPDGTAGLEIVSEAASTKLPAPKNVTATLNGNKAVIKWSKVTGADAYRLYQYSNETKKYEVVKTVTSLSATAKDLVDGEKYRFLVKALSKNGKKYVEGKASQTVAVTLPKVWKVIKHTYDDLSGAWKYYDFRSGVNYAACTNYDPNKKESSITGWLEALQFVSNNKALLACDGWWSNFSYDLNKLETGIGYKVCRYGKDLYLFYQFVNGDGDNTYVFKKENAASSKEQINDINKLAGTWYSIDFCDCPISDSASYDPRVISNNTDLYFESITVKGNKATFTYNDSNEKFKGNLVEKDKLDGHKYFVYEIDGTMYLYYEWHEDSFYVFKKY